MRVRFYCENDKCELELVNGYFGLMFGCPKYLLKNRTKKEKMCITDISVLEKQLIEKKFINSFRNNELKEGSTIEVAPRTYTVLFIDRKADEILVTVKKEGIKNEYNKNWKSVTNQNVF